MPPMQFPPTRQSDAARLPPGEQRQGGTWSELFDTADLQNRYQPLSVLIWYLSISLLGMITYPLLRLAAARVG